MAGTVYSHRFIFSSVAGAWRYYTVPAGNTAVVKYVSCVNSSVTDFRLYLAINDVSLTFSAIQAQTDRQLVNQMIVVRAGDTLGALMYGTDGVVVVCGYLLAGVPPPTAGLLPAPKDPPWELPEFVPARAA